MGYPVLMGDGELTKHTAVGLLQLTYATYVTILFRLCGFLNLSKVQNMYRKR